MSWKERIKISDMSDRDKIRYFGREISDKLNELNSLIEGAEEHGIVVELKEEPQQNRIELNRIRKTLSFKGEHFR